MIGTGKKYVIFKFQNCEDLISLNVHARRLYAAKYCGTCFILRLDCAKHTGHGLYCFLSSLFKLAKWKVITVLYHELD